MQLYIDTSKRVIVLVLLSALCVALMPDMADAAISDWQRGASIQPTSPTSFSNESLRQSLTDLKVTNANYVNFVIPIYQDNVRSSTLYAGSDTPTDASIAAGIDMAHSLGLKVSLKPHPESRDGQWRAFIDPNDRAAWFASYGSFIKRYAQIAQDHNVELFMVGTELINLSSDDHHPQNTSSWRTLIGDVRTIYTGKITYAANWGRGLADEKNRITFWDALDYAGIDAYYPLGEDYGDNSVETFRAAWAEWDKTDIKPFADRVGKSVIFTEVGYRSTNGAHIDPGNYRHSDGVSQQEQVNAYEALFSYWNDKSYIAGIHMWNWQEWSTAGGANDQDYTPQNKLALGTLKKWFSFVGTKAFPVTSNTYSFEVVSEGEALVPVGQSTPIKTIIKNTGGAHSGLLVDVEVYQGTQKVFQKFFEGESFEEGVSKEYSINWAPGTAGDYRVTAGVFNSNWSKNYLWKDPTFTFKAGTTTVIPKEGFTATGPTSLSGVVNTMVSPEATVKNTGDALTNILVDLEVYDAFGQKVAQRVIENQSFAKGATVKYQLPWTPSSAGSYSFKVGVFSAGWSKNYVWNDNATTITITPKVENPPDTIGPVVSVTTPSSNATTTGTTILSAQATDNVGIKSVQFSIDGQNVGSEDTQSPYSISWDSKSVTDGAHTVRVTAKDTSNNTTVSEGVSVNVLNQAPTVPPVTPTPPPQATTTPPIATTTPPVQTTCGGAVPSNSFKACYFDNKDFTNLKVSKTENSIDFDWGGGSPSSTIEPDTFSAIWEGSFNYEAGVYRFTTYSDDGVRLYVDGKLILNKWMDQVAGYEVEEALSAGAHTIKVEYYENNNGARMNMRWNRVSALPSTGTTPQNPQNPQTPIPPPATPEQNRMIEIWWPSQDVTLGGDVPLKALVKDVGVNEYDMYWSVDGSEMAQMGTSPVDYPHKEIAVSTNNPKFKAGSNTITFTAKNAAGTTIAVKTTRVTIQR